MLGVVVAGIVGVVMSFSLTMGLLEIPLGLAGSDCLGDSCDAGVFALLAGLVLGVPVGGYVGVRLGASMFD